MLILSFIVHFLGTLLLFLASEKADYHRGKLAILAGEKRTAFRIVSLVLMLAGFLVAIPEIGFAASIFFGLVGIMTFLSFQLLFAPLLFNNPLNPTRSNARK